MHSEQDDPTAGTDGNALPQPVAKKSIWDKAKASIGDISSAASTVAAMGTASAAKSAEVSKRAVDAATEATLSVVDAGMQVYTGSQLQSAVNYFDAELEQRGAKKAARDTADAIVGKLDQVTGKRLVELLEEKLRIQDAYNNILATRLAEALDRIANLEAKLNGR